MQASLRFLWLALVATSIVSGWSVCSEQAAWAFQAPTQPVADEVATQDALDDAAPPADPPAVAQPPRQRPFLTRMIRSSGVFGFMIFLTAIVMVVLVGSQMLELRRANYLPAAFLEDFERLLNEKNFQGAFEAAKADDSFMGRVLAAGMARLPRGYDDAVQGMQAVGEDETVAMEQSIGYLWLIAAIAPMLGLLGTVQGMLMSFDTLATSAAPRPHELAEGISTALFTTLEGLLVAIPAMIFYVILKNRLVRFVMEAGSVSEELMKRFQGMGKTAAPSSLRPAASPLTTAPTSPLT